MLAFAEQITTIYVSRALAGFFAASVGNNIKISDNGQLVWDVSVVFCGFYYFANKQLF